MVHRVPVVGRRLGEGLGALREREYRLLFGATLTTSVGGAVGTIALAFAVLDVAGATSLGIVIAVRQGASAAVLVFGGVLSDRARRNLAPCSRPTHCRACRAAACGSSARRWAASSSSR